MCDQNTPAPYILLKQQMGERKPNQEGEKPFETYFYRGDLLLEIPEEEQIPREDRRPPHNYCKYDDPAITTYNSGTNVSPLHGPELDYLQGIYRSGVRAIEYLQVDKLTWIMDLRLGSKVFFQLDKEKDVPLIIPGKIRYYGGIPGHDGVWFGIEIIDKEHRGKGTTDGYPYFQCGDNNAVYVSMDKIIMSRSIEKKDQPGLRKENPLALNTRSRTSDKPSEEGSTKKKEGKGILEKVKDKAKAFTTGAPITALDSISDVDPQFSEGDGVVIQTVRDKPITGTVRWVGPVKTSREDGGIVVPVVGIETDKKIDVDKEFPDLHMTVTGSHGYHLFSVTSNHSRVFLPELLVLHVDEYTKQKQENNTFEVQEAQKWGLSVEGYRAQEEITSKGNEKSDKQKCDKSKNKEVLQEMIPVPRFTLDTLQSLLKEKESMLKHKRQEYSEEDIAVVYRTIQELTNQNSQLTRDKEFLNSTCSQLSEGYKELWKVHDDLKSSHHRQQTELTNIVLELHTLQEDHLHLQTKTTEQERKQREAHETAKRREDEIIEAYKNLQETSREEYQKLKTDHQKLQQDHEEMKQDHHTLQQECQKQQQDLNTVRTDHQQLQIVLRQKDRDHQIEKTHLEEQIRKREESWKVNHKDVKITQRELGRGGWGVIQVGLFREQRVAVKQLYKVITSEDNLALMHREINTMSKLRHPNLLLFIGAVLDHPSGNPLIITEIMDASLRDVYKRNQLTSEMMKLTILRDVAAGLNYLHCLDDPIIHRDVSSANVLLESKGPDRWKAKLSDFGSANIARNAITTAPGAAVYSPPECVATVAIRVRKKQQTTKIDVFSFGVLLCEIMTCRFPDLDQFHGMLQNVATSSPPIAQLIRTCVEEEAENRPTIRTVIQQLDERVKSLTK